MITSFKANVAVLGSALVILAVFPGRATAQEAKGADKTAAAASTLPKVDEREVIPGADSMTSAERDAYRRRMAAAATQEEKARIRAEYAKGQDAVAPVPALVGDPARGAKLHR